MKIQKILCPVDFSPSSDRSLAYAIELAKELGAAIHLIHSYQVNPAAVSPYGPAMHSDFIESFRKGAEELMAKTAETVQAAGLDVKTLLTRDFPSQAIADAAAADQIDLIVMGTRGLSGLKHILLGSVAERTLRMAPCPVLTVGHVEGDS